MTRVAVVALVAVSFMVIGLAQPAGRQSWVIAALAITILVVGLASLALLLSGIDPDNRVLASRLAAEPDQQRLLERWLSRARWHRRIGGLAGIVTAYATASNGNADPLTWGVAGITIGAMIAELHHVRRRKGPRTAGLDVRSIGDYLSNRSLYWMVAVGAIASGVVVAAILRSDIRTAGWYAGATLVALALVRLVQHRVATRPRSALGTGLAQADDLARELAIGRGLAQPVTYLGLALLAAAFQRLEPVWGDGATLLSVVAWLTALVLWWRNRGLGLNFLFDRQQPVLS